ncbi:hypothetical protein GO755_25580 [Spirosoma sp. HMF4905]|uniref:Uncharacterized protein n=1 Tax=Spirosoma arboris TaxID=2682092 RepID=A0A7K1SI93_9BACT|nr:hypothetical protein [Spirosoma arboris]MVM33434.1 hypothetical protein [Spirosoma arboris]
MEDQDKVEPDYLKGFNEGYTIAAYMPELAEQLAKINVENIRNAGFQAGRQQLIKEQTRDRLPSWLKGDRPNTPNRTKGRHIEPDKD